MLKVLINVNSTCLPTIGSHVGYISGVGRSTENLVKALSRMHDPEMEVQTILESHRYWGKYTLNHGLRHHWTFLPYRYSGLFRKFLTYDLYHYPDNFHASYYPGEKFLITIHDTIQYEDAIREQNEGNMRQIEKNVADCLGIITCSEYSKKQILSHFDVQPEKISVIPWGVDMDMFRVKTQEDIKGTLSSLGITQPYFLAVSCREERKNIRMLLKAFRTYAAKHQTTLVLIWGNPPASILQEYEPEIQQGRIRFIDYVTDQQLVDLYNGAKATLFPSRQEGFGFPILESYACGTPVMTCRNSSLMEVGGDFACYVGEDDVEGMASAMSELDLLDKQAFQERIQPYVFGFSWEKTGEKYLNLYKDYCQRIK